MSAISVIIPAFRPKSFSGLAASKAANEGSDTEWIVIDDGSGPEFDSVFSVLPAGVKLIRQSENRGQGAARNAGLSVAKGRWIKFLDADDGLDTGHLATLLAAAESLPDGAIPFAPTSHVFANGRTSLNSSWRDLAADPAAQYLRMLVRPFLSHCGALFPRELLRNLRGYDEDLTTDEDGDLLLRVLKAGHHFVPVDGVRYLYIHHNAAPRVSTDDNIAKMQARIRVCDKVEAAWTEKMPDEVAYALAQRMDKIAVSYWPVFPEEARGLLERAQLLSPGYRPDINRTLRLLRAAGGPSFVSVARLLFRRLKGWSAIGTGK